MNTTTKFQAALPYAILPISPPLAALHATRARQLSKASSEDRDWCNQCGSYLLNGGAEIRAIRPKKKKQMTSSSRALQKSCRTCGWAIVVPIKEHNASTYLPPPQDRQNHTEEAQLSAPIPSQPVLKASVSVSSPAPVQTKSRPKKRSRLQDMLSQNREKEEKQRLAKKDGQFSGGLADFLSGL